MGVHSIDHLNSILEIIGRMDQEALYGPTAVPNSRTQSRSSAKRQRAKNKTVQQSPHLNKLFSKPINKPVLSISQKFQLGRSSNKFQKTLTNFQTPKSKENRFYETVSNGFILNERPVSKQQSRSGLGDSDIFGRRECQKLIISEIEDLENESSDHEKVMQKVTYTRDERPQTSKGERVQDKRGSKCLNEGRKKSDAQNIEGQNWSQCPKKSHPYSAMQRERGSILDDLIRINSRPSDKKARQNPNCPLQSLIDSEFLSLFANGD